MKDGLNDLRQLKVTRTLSEEPAEFETTFHYRLEKELKLGINEDTGEACEIYCKVTINHTRELDQEHFHKHIIRNQIANEMDIGLIQYIVPVTEEEYRSDTEE